MPTDTIDAATELAAGRLEVRTLADPGKVQTRAAGDDKGPGLVGYGSVFGQTSRIEGYWEDWDEVVEAGAFAKTIVEGDVRSMFNHDNNWLLGRTSAGTLHLSEDDEGLRYEVDINEADPNAMSVHAKVDRGDVSGSSIWFRIVRQEITLPSDDNDLEVPLRRILEIQLFETGPVVWPAFETTSVGARSIESLDATLRSLGISKAGQRAAMAADLLADPTRAAELRELVERFQTDLGHAASPEARGQNPATPPVGHLAIDTINRRARGLAALTGLPLPEGM